ncbi:MAG TPA: HAMP domain-containing sensor histidine kinase [Candidatus Methylomirabilis sp.]|nr:HAMP domain-containing sensor histidine kinase [Candidatus Methylomirabilis sp.]
MTRLMRSFTFRLALGCGALVVGALAVMAAVLYGGTVGVIGREINANLLAMSVRLTRRYQTDGIHALQEEIEQLLTDKIDQDTEVYLLLGPSGEQIAGNISNWEGRVVPDRLTEQSVTRYDRPSVSRILLHRLPNGYTLVVGRDLQDVRVLQRRLRRALLLGGTLAFLLTIGGAALFHRQLERQVAAIRRTAQEIEAGDLSRRIPVGAAEDEFTRLNRALNHLLDYIHQLMEGVRSVSNAIAHDLRTPLSRVRNLLDDGLRPGTPPGQMREIASTAIRRIDELASILDKLLQIAAAESGTPRTSFRPVALAPILTDVAELYDATAEAQGMALVVEDLNGAAIALGDKNLLASAIANLVDNALKYAGRGATVRVRALCDQLGVSVVVQDNGPGIPPEERAKVLTRFYRLDRSRTLPGNGLGLSIVAAISQLHGGTFLLEDAAPGLRARMLLPRSSLPDITKL